MTIEEFTLRTFLTRANVSPDVNLPWVHSTAASRLISIINNRKLLATPCNVFIGEKLCYLFVGRAAYKTKSVPNPSEWQLPVVFVVRFRDRPKLKRVFPFDSGAFRRRLLPDYITTFDLEGYDLADAPENIGRLVSLCFDGGEGYMKRKAVSEDKLSEKYALDLRHQQVLALMRLYAERSTAEYDDRAAAVEIQLSEDVALAQENLLGVVMPTEFRRTPGLVDAIKQLTQVIECYDHMPLSTECHYGQIYDCVRRVYRRAGIRL